MGKWVKHQVDIANIASTEKLAKGLTIYNSESQSYGIHEKDCYVIFHQTNKYPPFEFIQGGY